MERKLTRLIGDIHGDVQAYSQIISNCERSIQVGDFGQGWLTFNPAVPNKHEYIRGNHDNPNLCKMDAAWIPDGTVKNDVMFVGGAWSIDWAYRTPGLSWWEDEECSHVQLEHFIDKYTEVKPRVMITHECPDSIAGIMCASLGKTKYDMPSRTRDAFDIMFHLHKPEYWIFGHWHNDWQKEIEGTRFICLDINDYIDLEI